MICTNVSCGCYRSVALVIETENVDSGNTEALAVETELCQLLAERSGHDRIDQARLRYLLRSRGPFSHVGKGTFTRSLKWWRALKCVEGASLLYPLQISAVCSARITQRSRHTGSTRTHRGQGLHHGTSASPNNARQQTRLGWKTNV